MKKLCLVSSFMDTKDIIAQFVRDLNGSTVTFIPTASAVEEVTFYVDAARKELKQMGLTVDELDLSAASREEIASKIQHNDYIYVTGGNTFYLLQELKRTGADQMIIDAVRSGKPYIGESAGSIITAANIEYVQEMDDIRQAPGLDNCDALALVDFYTVPHYTNPPFKESAQSILDTYSYRLELSPIRNDQAIVVDGNEIQIITVEA